MTWNNLDNTLKEALDLPLGRIAVDMGITVEGFIRPNDTLVAGCALKDFYLEYPYDDSVLTVATQAELIVKARELELAFTEFPEFILIEGTND